MAGIFHNGDGRNNRNPQTHSMWTTEQLVIDPSLVNVTGEEHYSLTGESRLPVLR